MDANLIVALIVLSLFFLLGMGLPVAFALALSGAVGIVLLTSADVATSVFGAEVFETVVNYTLVVIPLFILMGMCVKNSRLGEEVFWVLSRALRRIPGGLGLSAVTASAIFATMTGSSAAAVATLGPIAIPEMRRHGYSDRLASGTIAAAGTLGMLIPPSVVLVLYGVLSGLSVERLLIAGIVPGFLTAALYAAVAVWMGRSEVLRDSQSEGRPKSSSHTTRPPSSGDDTAQERQRTLGGVTLDNLHSTLPNFSGSRALAEVSSLFLVVIGGMYVGFFTAVESAAVGAILALLILVLRAWREPRNVVKFIGRSLKEAVELSGMIYALLIGASIFTLFMTMARVPQNLSSFITELPIPPALIVVLILLALVPLGMFLDGFSILLVMVPLLHPIVVGELGFDGIWFGILVVKCIELGLITPPVGINVYVTAGSVAGLHASTVFRGVMPFFIVDALGISVMFLFPEVIAFLPDLMLGR